MLSTFLSPDFFYLCVVLQQNHEALMSLYKDVETGTYVPDTASSSWKDRKKEEQRLIDDLLVHFSKSSQFNPKTKARHTTAYRTLYLTRHSLKHQIFWIAHKVKKNIMKCFKI